MEQLVKAGRTCSSEDGDESQNKQCVEGAVCKKYCEPGRESEAAGCNFWCVMEDGADCEDDNECMSEYCDMNAKKCSSRNQLGQSCDRRNMCETYICVDGVCSDVPIMNVPPTFSA